MNTVKLIGTITGINYSHEAYGERFYLYLVSCERLSKTEDEVNVIVSERLANDIYEGSKVTVKGEFRSHNIDGHLFLYLFADELYLSNKESHTNNIVIDGYLGKEPNFKQSPTGRKLTELLIASNRRCGKTDYIPCIVWGRNSLYANKLHVGDHVELSGRIQSRLYTKNDISNKTVEVSVNTISKRGD